MNESKMHEGQNDGSHDAIKTFSDSAHNLFDMDLLSHFLVSPKAKNSGLFHSLFDFEFGILDCRKSFVTHCQTVFQTIVNCNKHP